MITVIAVIVFLSIFTVFLPIETCSATGDTLHVGIGQTYSNIQDAIDAANESDTVYVHNGTYDENLVIDRTITLTGEGTRSVTVNGNGDHTIKIYNNSVQISGFTIKNTGESFGCVFLDFVTDCLITNNVVKNGGNGVYLGSSDSNTIKDNTVESSNIGIYLFNSDSNTIKSNNIQSNGMNGIFFTSSSSGNTIYLNDFSDNSDSNARDLGSNNWDYSSQGNYWDDYSGVDESPEDGIGDTPYSIPGGSNKDSYPLGYFTGGNQPPTAEADGPYSGQINSEIVFDSSGSSDSDGNIVGYRWDWTNDDSYDTGWLSTSTTTHSYSSAGTYTVKLQVKDDDEATDTDTAQVTVISVNQKPTAYILEPTKPITKYYGEPVEFLGSWSDDGQVVEYSWRSSIDDVLSNALQFTINNLTVGQHTIYFKVRDNDGEWSSEVSIAVTIIADPSNSPPVAGAGGPYTGYVNQSITFDGSSSYDPDGDEIVAYVWDFGDGANGTGVSIEHTYNSSGNYTVNLTVTDSQGNPTTISTYANVGVQPTDQNGDVGENGGTPGFELIFVVIAIAFVLLWRREVKK